MGDDHAGSTRSRPTSDDRRARAVAFGGFSALAGRGRRCRGGRVDGVLAMSPPLTLGLTAWAVARRPPVPRWCSTSRTCSPTSPSSSGRSPTHRVIAAARWLERVSYRARRRGHRAVRRPRATTSRPSSAAEHRGEVRVIPNFVDTDAIRPAATGRRPTGASSASATRPVVMYAGNVGFSQSLDLLVAAAAPLRHRAGRDVRGQRRRLGLRRPRARRPPAWPTSASSPTSRRSAWPRCWPPATSTSCRCAGAWPARACRRRPTRSSPPAARCWPRRPGHGGRPGRRAEAGAGVAVPPDDADAFTRRRGRPRSTTRRRWSPWAQRGRAWVERWASPAAVAEAYERLFAEVGQRHGRPGGRALRPLASPPRGQGIVGQEGRSFAKSSGGRKVRSQQGLVFPVALVVVARARAWSSSVYARRRATRTSAATAPITTRSPATTGTPPTASTSATSSSCPT